MQQIMPLFLPYQLFHKLLLCTLGRIYASKQVAKLVCDSILIQLLSFKCLSLPGKKVQQRARWFQMQCDPCSNFMDTQASLKVVFRDQLYQNAMRVQVLVAALSVPLSLFSHVVWTGTAAQAQLTPLLVTSLLLTISYLVSQALRSSPTPISSPFFAFLCAVVSCNQSISSGIQHPFLCLPWCAASLGREGSRGPKGNNEHLWRFSSGSSPLPFWHPMTQLQETALSQSIASEWDLKTSTWKVRVLVSDTETTTVRKELATGPVPWMPDHWIEALGEALFHPLCLYHIVINSSVTL